MTMPKTPLGVGAALSLLLVPLSAFAQDVTPGVGASADRSATTATCTPETGRHCIIMRGHCELECTIVSDLKGCQWECERGFQECHRPGC